MCSCMVFIKNVNTNVISYKLQTAATFKTYIILDNNIYIHCKIKIIEWRITTSACNAHASVVP